MLNKFVGTTQVIKAKEVAVVDATKTVDMGMAIDQAFYTEGNVYVFHPDPFVSEEKVKYLNDELEFELEQLIESLQTGALTESKLEEQGFADDVLGFLLQEARRKPAATEAQAVKEEVSQSQVEEIMKQMYGVSKGEEIQLGNVAAVVTGFSMTTEGAHVVLDVNGEAKEVHVDLVVETKKEMEMKEMANEIKEVVVAGTNEVEETTMTNEETIANSGAANAFLSMMSKQKEQQATTQTKQTEKVENTMTTTRKLAPATTENKQNEKVENTMKTARKLGTATQTTTQTNTKEETKMNNTAKQETGRRQGTMGQAAQTGRTSRVLGNVQNGRVVDPKLAGVFDEVKGKETAANPNKGLPWYFQADRYEGVNFDTILDTRTNDVLGITDISIYAPESVVENPGDEIAYVGVTIGHSIVIRFKLKLNSNAEASSPITSTNIKWFTARNGQMYPDYVFYRKNVKEVTIKCACGKWNTIKETGKAQKCECGKQELGYVDEVVGGEDVSQNYVATRLPFGFTIDRAVLAQAMVFAHLKLAAAYGF